MATVSRCCCRDRSGSVAGAEHADDIFVTGRREEVLKMGALIKRRWETRDQLIGPGSDDRRELHDPNRTLMDCLVSAADVRYGSDPRVGVGQVKNLQHLQS